MAKSDPIVEIGIDQLRNGMHVVELDISWMDSPFLLHARTIREGDIETLRKCGVKLLKINTDKGLAPEKSQPMLSWAKSDRPHIKGGSGDSEAPRSSLADELQAAQTIRSKVRKTVESLHETLGKRLSADTSGLMPLIDQTLGSLERNNQALMSLVHLTKVGRKLADHTFSVFCLALNIGKRLKLSPAELEDLGLAALLHEVGWSQLPMNLMGKRTPWTATEIKLIHKHPGLGLLLLKGMDLSETCIRAIREHHELGDGSGYPAGLTLDQLHPVSKILIIADQYDELINQLHDRRGMLPTNALRKLYLDAEKGLFETRVVAAFIDSVGIYPVTTAVKLSSGEKAVVIEVRDRQPLQPVVMIHYDSDGKLLPEARLEDLADTSKSLKKIDSVLDPENPEDDPSRRLRPDL